VCAFTPDTVRAERLRHCSWQEVAGERLIGLQYAVLARGARSVVSSLWPAIDQSHGGIDGEVLFDTAQQQTTVISSLECRKPRGARRTVRRPGTWGAFMLTLSHVQRRELKTAARFEHDINNEE